jgi:chromate transport protein ChrA
MIIMGSGSGKIVSALFILGILTYVGVDPEGILIDALAKIVELVAPGLSLVFIGIVVLAGISDQLETISEIMSGGLATIIAVVLALTSRLIITHSPLMGALLLITAVIAAAVSEY